MKVLYYVFLQVLVPHSGAVVHPSCNIPAKWVPDPSPQVPKSSWVRQRWTHQRSLCPWRRVPAQGDTWLQPTLSVSVQTISDELRDQLRERICTEWDAGRWRSWCLCGAEWGLEVYSHLNFSGFAQSLRQRDIGPVSFLSFCVFSWGGWFFL